MGEIRQIQSSLSAKKASSVLPRKAEDRSVIHTLQADLNTVNDRVLLSNLSERDKINLWTETLKRMPESNCETDIDSIFAKFSDGFYSREAASVNAIVGDELTQLLGLNCNR